MTTGSVRLGIDIGGTFTDISVFIVAGDGDAARPSWICFDIEVGDGRAHHSKDGLDCYSQGIHNLANTPMEMIEASYPLRFKRDAFLADTGGVGQYRGGLGVARDVEFLDECGSLNTQLDRFKLAPFGLFGDGATGRLTLKRGACEPRQLASKTVDCKLERGDVISMWTQGGGGYDRAAQRDPTAIARDLRQGKTTFDKASVQHNTDSAAE